MTSAYDLSLVARLHSILRFKFNLLSAQFDCDKRSLSNMLLSIENMCLTYTFANVWRVIESAPADQVIWAFNGEQGAMKCSEGDGWALWIWADEYLSDVDPSPAQPSHWRPLPEAPK